MDQRDGVFLNPLALIGRWFLALLTGLGELTLFAGHAVVYSSILILTTDYVLTELLFFDQ